MQAKTSVPRNTSPVRSYVTQYYRGLSCPPCQDADLIGCQQAYILSRFQPPNNWGDIGFQGGHPAAIADVIEAARRALAAVAALEPFNRTPTADFPAFPQPYFQPGISQQQLDAQASAGPTGSTGATSDIAPPAALDPTPATHS